MAVTRCENGHFFDNAKSQDCPHCRSDLQTDFRQELNEGKTVFGQLNTVPTSTPSKQKIRIDMGDDPARPVDEKTVGVFRSEKGCYPVVGWLVCTEGDERGRDYRLHAGRNFIGRGLKSDVSLPDDEQISREDHCSIVFEPKKCTYAIVRGGGDLQVDGKSIMGSQKLEGDELITIGASKFVFIPYCKEERIW